MFNVNVKCYNKRGVFEYDDTLFGDYKTEKEAYDRAVEAANIDKKSYSYSYTTTDSKKEIDVISDDGKYISRYKVVRVKNN